MQSEGLRAQIGYKRRPGKYGTQPAVVAANQLQQDFNINAPDTVWVTDIPYIRTHEGGHLEERVFWASIEANFIVGSQVRLHRVTNACPQAYFGMILARISGGIRILNRIRLWAVVAHGKRGGGSCSLGWPW